MWSYLVGVGIICFGIWVAGFGLAARDPLLQPGPVWMLWLVAGSIFTVGGMIVRQLLAKSTRNDEEDADPLEEWFSQSDRRETFYGLDDGFRDRTVGWWVEALPDRGPCHMCRDIYGRDLMQHTGLPSFAVHNKDGTNSLGSCGFHLETTLIMWDTIQAEIHDQVAQT